MIKVLFFGIFIVSISFFQVQAQTPSQDLSVLISATVQNNPASVSLNWLNNASPGTDYIIFRKIKGASSWGGVLGTVNSMTLSYTDNAVIPGTSYEYQIQKKNGASAVAWGYINAGIESEINVNKGDCLLIVDDRFTTSLYNEIDTLKQDLENDGWDVSMISVNINDTVTAIKSTIVNNYYSLPNLKTVYLLGHIPVPYSGLIYPDGHSNHIGAWPADVYYADINGIWTDVSVNNSNASDSRNKNIPNDGKFDQSNLPSDVELQIGRVDFYDMPAFNDTEELLLKKYLSKAHEFKVAKYIPAERGLIDYGNFGSYTEGFAQSGFRNFTSFFGDNNVVELDYATELGNNDYLWSYGCGAGSYTSAAGLDNGTSLTTAELNNRHLKTTFTTLFGSYFGDWDKTNNFLRAGIASGKTLSNAWGGRPNWHFHNMASGDHIGESTLLSQNNSSQYYSGYAGRSIHIALMGDPSLRLYYIKPPANLIVSNTVSGVDLNWTISTDATIDGYQIYRRKDSSWQKVNSTLITGSTYSDAPPTNGNWEYLVKAIKLKSNASGTFYNQSLGTKANTNVATITNFMNKSSIKIYPNPAHKSIVVSGIPEGSSSIKIYSVNGALLFEKELVKSENTIELDLKSAFYFIGIFNKDKLIYSQALVIE